MPFYDHDRLFIWKKLSCHAITSRKEEGMRKVRTALDTAIRTKSVRSFSGRSGRYGGYSRRNPDTGIAIRSISGNGRQRQASSARFRREGLAALSPAQRRAFERLPLQKQEELLIKAERKIDRRISAGRYRETRTPAVVAEGSAGIWKGRARFQESRMQRYSERMGQFGWGENYSEPYPAGPFKDGQFQKAHAGYQGMQRQQAFQTEIRKRQDQQNTDVYGPEEEGPPQSYDRRPDSGRQELFWKENSINAGYRRKRHARWQEQKKKEKRIQKRRESGTSYTRTDSIDAQKGVQTDAAAGSSGEAQKTGGKADKRIGRDYAKVLGRMIESQVRFTRQLENSRSFYQKQKTIQEMEEKEARRISGIVSISLSKAKVVLGDLVKAAKFLMSKGKGYLILLLVPVMLLVMMVPLLLSSVSLTEEEATASATATELVEYALSWVGVTQYVWGAGRAYETDWQDYTDCSGFVHGVFSHFGYEIGGTTVYMEGSGTLIDTNSTAKALPGDIILFFTGSIAPGNSTHVGIYIGDGQMVHCTGSRSNVSPETAGPGVMVTMVSYSSRQYQVRRIIPEDVSGGVGTGGHRVDPTKYSTSDLQLIWAIVAQEDNGSYEGALAVISSAMNRTESPTWSYLGNTAMKQLCAPGQYCYSNDNYWVPRLGGNVPEYVKQAVNDCLKKGIRNHSFTSFRSTKGKTTGPNAVQIGGNWFFGN